MARLLTNRTITRPWTTSFYSLLPIKHPNTREIAYKAIKEAILSGQLGPNQPLVEEQLASMLQISRTPVREALAILEHEGLIGPQGSRGLVVRTLTRKEFIEIFTANEIVEPDLARRAAHLVTEEQLQVLGETVNRGRYYAAEGDFTQFLRSGREFHRLLGIAAENNPLTDFIVRNEERVDLYLISSRKNIRYRHDAGLQPPARSHSRSTHPPRSG